MLTRNSSDAEDLTQTTFLRCLLNEHRFDGSNMKSWAVTVMRNEFINNFRAKKRRGGGPVELSVAFGLKDPSINSNLETKDILKMIDSMPLKFRKVIRMRIDGYKYEEISRILIMNIGTVKSRIFFARKNFLR
jgi:RNA polymerase sigma-70 factor (ECF subfamily)